MNVRLTIAVLLVAVILFHSILQAQTPVEWLTLNDRSSLSAEFEALLLEQLQSSNQFEITNRYLDQTALYQELTSSGPKKNVLIHCNLQTYVQMLKDPEMKSLLESLKIGLVNGRLISLPFYIFGDSVQQLDHVPIAYLTLPLEQIYPLEEADLLTMFSRILSKPKNQLHIYREREAYTAAKKLFDGTYKLVGIYEDEPSTLLHEFQVNLTQELGAPPARLLPIDSASSQNLNEVSAQRLKYIFFVYESDPFFDSGWLNGKIPVPGIVQQTQIEFPVVLSNLPVADREFSKALSNAYFLMIPKLSTVRFQNETERRGVHRMYLLNAYLNDPENKYTSLGFLGYLLMMKDEKWKSEQEKDVYEQKCLLFQKKLKLNRITARDLFAWLDLQIPKLDKRDLFTDDVSRLYQNALARIEEGQSGTPEKRKQKLEEARKYLIAAMMHAEEPKYVKGGRGLWSVADYNPYYQLARVSFHLKKLEIDGVSK